MTTPVPSYFPGMGPLRGFNAPEPEATAEQVQGGPADPFHGQSGEAAQPYSWQSQLMNYTGMTGPQGPENQLLGNTAELEGLPEGQLGHDKYADLTPYRGHAAPTTVTLSGPLPSQYDAINEQLVQAAEIRGTDLGASRSKTLDTLGDVVQDHWNQIWDVSESPELYPAGEKYASGISLFGFANNDRPVNPFRKMNSYGFQYGHHHRRYAAGSIPGNYMWMRPGSRPQIKSLPGPARPAVGKDSPFEGDDLGQSFGIHGAVLVQVPTEYQPPPSPQLAAPISYDEPAPGVPLW